MATGQYGSPEQAQAERQRLMDNQTFRDNAYLGSTFGTNKMSEADTRGAISALQAQGLDNRQVYEALQSQYGVDPREYGALMDPNRTAIQAAGGLSAYQARQSMPAGWDPTTADGKPPAAAQPAAPVYDDTTENLQRQLGEARAAAPGMTNAQLKQIAMEKYGVSPEQWNMINWSQVPGNAAGGGIGTLSRFVQGPGDGVSDGIPALINGRQPARMADGEFVVDARTVAEIGNGSSQAGAKKLYAMQDRVHRARKTAPIGKPSQADKYLPA
jgi:hypothetical protein